VLFTPLPSAIPGLAEVVSDIDDPNKKYMNMKHLEAACQDASIAG